VGDGARGDSPGDGVGVVHHGSGLPRHQSGKRVEDKSSSCVSGRVIDDILLLEASHHATIPIPKRPRDKITVAGVGQQVGVPDSGIMQPETPCWTRHFGRL
jgi:hypothetical protein